MTVSEPRGGVIPATNEPAADDSEALLPGAKVGEYRIESLLGEGGFGAVYRATHPLIGKTAAIKVIKLEYSGHPEMVSRFVAEARAVNAIGHRNIIDIFGFGRLPDGRHYYVMELLDGVTLEAHIQARGALPVEEALEILRPLARALATASLTATSSPRIFSWPTWESRSHW
jgi:eukaryotic-like serine/threonine-protein kinase